jgi:ABC-2 type transport system ATP-binding protein
MTQLPTIECQGLRKRFGRRVALDGVDTAIGAGERVALIGQNGAGKTTLIRCLLGQHRYEGGLTVFGLEPRQERVRVLERIGYVPQTPPPLLTTVGELLDFSLGLNARQTMEAVATLAAILGIDLADLANHTFSRLSGGMKQKVLIALALTKEPDLLILDEPAANLDPEGRAALFGHLRAMPPQVTMLIISHRVDEVASLIDRVIEMDRGQIVVDRRQAGANLPRAVER